MKPLQFFLFLSLIAQSVITTAFAKTSSLEFMTPRDLTNSNTTANINLQNSGKTATTVYGLYVRQFAYVIPGESCNQATTMYSADITAGSVLMPILINAGKSAAIGQNYLYNMIFQANNYVSMIFPSSPPGCALPGCTWGSDSATYNWCIYLGALAPVSTSAGYTANVPPSTAPASSSGQYDYNLISNYVVLGPISCNDQTLTCMAANQQTQSFS